MPYRQLFRFPELSVTKHRSEEYFFSSQRPILIRIAKAAGHSIDSR